MQTLAALGHRVLAVDLPGFGRTPRTQAVDEPGGFLESVISTLSPDSPVVLVSPSMSGRFSLPVLTGLPHLLCGFVPVAPVTTDRFAPAFPSVRVPTLVVHGEYDTALGVRAAADLAKITTASKPQVAVWLGLWGGGETGCCCCCYLTRPITSGLILGLVGILTTSLLSEPRPNQE